MAEHVDIQDPQIHEPKGVLSAGADEVYVADGLGSGVWKQTPTGIDVANTGDVFVSDGVGGGAWQSPAASVSLNYGGMYSISTDAIAIATIGVTPKKLIGFSHNTPANGISPDHTADEITIVTAGDYLIPLGMTFSTAAVGDAGLYKFHVRVNGVQSVIGFHRQMSGTSDTGAAGTQGILTLAASDLVSVWVESDDGGNTDDITIEMVSLDAILLKAA